MKAFEAVLTISSFSDFGDRFINFKRKVETVSTNILNRTQSIHVDNFVVNFYDSLSLYGMALKSLIDDGERKENEQQKEEDKGQRDEEDIRDIRQKEDNNEKKSNKKSIDNQGLPAGWSRLSVPRKNGTHVDYYLVNQQVIYGFYIILIEASVNILVFN